MNRGSNNQFFEGGWETGSLCLPPEAQACKHVVQMQNLHEFPQGAATRIAWCFLTLFYEQEKNTDEYFGFLIQNNLSCFDTRWDRKGCIILCLHTISRWSAPGSGSLWARRRACGPWQCGLRGPQRLAGLGMMYTFTGLLKGMVPSMLVSNWGAISPPSIQGDFGMRALEL